MLFLWAYRTQSSNTNTFLGCKDLCNLLESVEWLIEEGKNLFDTADCSWIEKSIEASVAEADAFFHLSDEFYPDPNNLDEATVIPLRIPSTVMEGTCQLFSRDAISGFSELVSHYHDVLNAAAENGQKYNDFSHHMWLRLVISSDDSAIFFEYDTWKRMKTLFEVLKTMEDGQQHSDVTQGWEIVILRVGSRLHFRQGGFDQSDEFANLSFPRKLLLDSFADLENRIVGLIERLTAEVGDDYWSEFRYDLIDYS